MSEENPKAEIPEALLRHRKPADTKDRQSKIAAFLRGEFVFDGDALDLSGAFYHAQEQGDSSLSF
jgi:hypothetical protein